MNKDALKLIITAIFTLALGYAITAFAASSFTTHYNLEKPAAGDTGWADALNSNSDEIDSQMWINQNSIANHIADTVGAHEASAISTTVGANTCITSITVQDYLDCLDSEFGTIVGGSVMTTNTDQNVTGAKTFDALQAFTQGITASGTLTFSGLSTGLLHADSSGVLSSSLLVDADVDAAAGISYSKLSLGNQIVNSDISSSAGIQYSKLDLSGSIVNSDVSASAGIVYSKLSLGDSIVNSDVNSAAAIAGTKISPDFGSQDVQTTGQVITPTLKAQSSAGLVIQSNSGTQIADMGAGGGAQAVFSGALETKSSLLIEDPGAGTNSVTIQSPTLASAYTLTLPTSAGSASQFLQTDGAGTLTWAAPTAGVGTYNAYAVDTTLSNSSPEQFVTASGSGTDITLYACGAGQAGYKVNIKRNDSTNAITVLRGSTDTIDGATSFSLGINLRSISMVCNGAGAWFIF